MNSAPSRKADEDITHHDIILTRDAYVWVDEEPVKANIHRFAGQIQEWMQHKGFVNFYLESDKKNYPHMYTNQFTFHTSTLAQVWQVLINEADGFAEGRIATDRSDVEIKYIRLRSELLIMGCRLVEAIIKQLLHCTDFSKKDYVKAAIGPLIAYDCKGCRSERKRTHKISMLGSVGHRYGLCRGYEECINKHIRRLATWRNEESSHASTHPFRGLSSTQVKVAMKDDLMAIGNLVHHILKHLSDYENRMITELETNVRLHNSALLEVRVPISEWDKMFPDTPLPQE